MDIMIQKFSLEFIPDGYNGWYVELSSLSITDRIHEDTWAKAVNKTKPLIVQWLNSIGSHPENKKKNKKLT
jgi:hypothetical protein